MHRRASTHPPLATPHALSNTQKHNIKTKQVETIAIAKLRSDPRLAFRREIILAKDGGAVAIDWEHLDLEEHVSACLTGCSDL